MVTIVVAQLSAADPPLRIVLDCRGWTDGTRPVYHYEVVYDCDTTLRGEDLHGPATGPAPTLRAAAASLAAAHERFALLATPTMTNPTTL